MFKKIRTTVHSSGSVETTEPLAWLDESSVQADMAQERRNLRQKAMTLGRISTVEETMTSLVVVYTTGTVVVFQWIAVAE